MIFVDNKKLAESKAYSIPPAMCISTVYPVNLSKIIFSVLNFFMHILHMSVTYLPSIKYSICALDENWLISKCCKFVKNIFLDIKLLHAHLKYVCNISAKYQMNILKALGGVDFTKYALFTISQYVEWTEIGKVKNAVNLSKIIFTANNFFMHIFNMSVTYLQSIKRIHLKL